MYSQLDWRVFVFLPARRC